MSERASSRTDAAARRATAADWPDVAALRTRVFVEEQGVPAEVEQDAHDATAVHALARDEDGRVVATGRLLVRDGRAVIGRMAVDAPARGAGHGAAVLAAVYLGTGSLLLPVLLHAAIDLRFLLVPSSALPAALR